MRINDATNLAIPPARRDRYARHVNKEMTFGLRPEHLTAFNEENKVKVGVARMEAMVDVVEPMGMETMVHFHTNGEPMCARIDPNAPVAPNKILALCADMNNMHMLDPVSGRVV